MLETKKRIKEKEIIKYKNLSKDFFVFHKMKTAKRIHNNIKLITKYLTVTKVLILINLNSSIPT